MNEKAAPIRPGKVGCTSWIITAAILGFVVLIISSQATCPPYCPSRGPKSQAMWHSSVIGLLLTQYAVDHDGKYPEGKTSTEVFQKLLDQKYAGDPSLFYLDLPDKVPPSSSHLKPENVGWDITCCVDVSAPDGLPVVFLTGYKIDYRADSRAVPLIRSKSPKRTWYEALFGDASPGMFMAVCYKSNSAQAIEVEADGSIPHFIPADFNPAGKTYHQLTP